MASEPRETIIALENLHGNPMAAVDIETTGGLGGYHEIIQIAIVPLDINLKPVRDILPFYHNIIPQYPERMEEKATHTHGLSLAELNETGSPNHYVIEYLNDWFSRLPISPGKRLTPLAANWAFEASFLKPWLGVDLFNQYFHPHPRDTMLAGTYINDRATVMGRPAPFKRLGLNQMAKTLGIVFENHHNALADAIAEAELYRKLVGL